MSQNIDYLKKEEKELVCEQIAGETFEFRYGLPGFEEFVKFEFEPIKEYRPFVLFKSVIDENVSMYVLNGRYFKVYDDIEIPKSEFDKIGLESSENFEMYFILRMDRETHKFIANLKAPLLINTEDHLGNQIYLDDENLSDSKLLGEAIKE